MATAAIIIGGAIINALAFSGSQALFKALGGDDEERERHDRAVEKLTKAREEWSRERQAVIDRINEQAKLGREINEADKRMREYFLATEYLQPKLSDFYVPSPDQENGEVIFISGSLLALGYVGYKYIF